MPEMSRRADPAPSRWAYRVHRILLTPLYRRLLRVGIPFTVCFAISFAYLSRPEVQQSVLITLADLRQQVEERPEFRVKLLAVEGASAGIAAHIHDSFPYALPASSFDMDLDILRESVEELPAVKSAAVRLRQGGVLEIVVTEREPAALLRTSEGLMVLDLEGVAIATAPSRAARPGLPLLTGAGAQHAVPEAIAIKEAAQPLFTRMLGLVRMGERRWDVVLDRDQRILLPETDPVRALERVIALHQNEELQMLERDVAAVDMRLAARPTLRMRERAVEGWWRVRNLSAGTGEP